MTVPIFLCKRDGVFQYILEIRDAATRRVLGGTDAKELRDKVAQEMITVALDGSNGL
jgi:hypothetical protein